VRLSDARCPCCRAPIASSDSVKPNTLLREMMTSMFPEQTRQAVKRSLPHEVIDVDAPDQDMEQIDAAVEEIFWGRDTLGPGDPTPWGRGNGSRGLGARRNRIVEPEEVMVEIEVETVNLRAPPGRRSVRRRIADNDIDSLVRDNPQYSRRAMSQLRAAIQANARQRA
jgi:hypothetical protein